MSPSLGHVAAQICSVLPRLFPQHSPRKLQEGFYDKISTLTDWISSDHAQMTFTQVFSFFFFFVMDIVDEAHGKDSINIVE